MISRRDFVKISAGAVAAASLGALATEEAAAQATGSLTGAGNGRVKVVAAYEWVNGSRYGTTLKGFEETLGQDPTAGAGQGGAPDMGSTISLFLVNQGQEPLTLDKILFDGIDTASQFDTPPYRIIWSRLLPATLAPQQEGELTISLRSRLSQPATITAVFKNGAQVQHSIGPNTARLRFGTIGFAADLSSCHVYIERVDSTAPFPRNLWLNGKLLRQEVSWLHNDFVDGCAIAIVSLPKSIKPGQFCSFRAGSGTAVCGATVRAFSDYARFGQYGYRDFEAMAKNGLDSFNSFAPLGKADLDEAAKHGIKTAMTVHDAVPKETVGHPGIYAYLPMDEVDVVDYSAAENRPGEFRIGKMGPEMTKWHEAAIEADPITPNMLTVDLTYKPQNYFIYAPMFDVCNGDCYPIAIGWQINSIREHARLLKSASGARPFTFAYQGHYERWGKSSSFVNRDTVLADGGESLIDPNRRRGFNRKPDIREVRQQMLYAIGCGARGLFTYTGATEGGFFVNIGSIDLPEIWSTIGAMTRSLRLVAPLIEIAHPTVWALSGEAKAWTSTLFCGEGAALVAVVNEDGVAGDNGFDLKDKNNVAFSFRDLPWLKANSVMKIENGTFTAVKAQRKSGALAWSEPVLGDCALYLISSSPNLGKRLVEAKKL